MYVDTNNPSDLLTGSASRIAADLGVTVRTVQQWQQGRTPPPAMVKLLQMRYGDLSGLLGPDWSGFYIGSDRQLYIPGWKYGWSAQDVKAMFFERQELRAARRDLVRLRAELEVLRAQVWAVDKVRGLSAPLDRENQVRMSPD